VGVIKYTFDEFEKSIKEASRSVEKNTKRSTHELEN